MAVPAVRDIMTRTVVAVPETADHREIMRALVANDLSVVPVVDAAGRVLGVVAEAHLLTGATGSARDLMAAPAVTIEPDAPVAAAARLMAVTHVGRLPVVDAAGRLVGIVSRRDLLVALQRSDPVVRDELAGPVLRRVLALRAPRVRVEAADGVVTLTGRTDRRSVAQLAVGLARAVPGVLDVVDRLSYELDDTPAAGRRAAVAVSSRP